MITNKNRLSTLLILFAVLLFYNTVMMSNKPYLEKLAKRLKELRNKKGLTQDDIGVNGVSRSMISLLELAKTDVTVTKLKIIADNLGVEVKDLFDF